MMGIRVSGSIRSDPPSSAILWSVLSSTSQIDLGVLAGLTVFCTKQKPTPRPGRARLNANTRYDPCRKPGMRQTCHSHSIGRVRVRRRLRRHTLSILNHRRFPSESKGRLCFWWIGGQNSSWLNEKMEHDASRLVRFSFRIGRTSTGHERGFFSVEISLLHTVARMIYPSPRTPD